MTYERPYAHSKRITRPMPEVVARVREALAVEGFGVLTEIDVQATLKTKLGVDRRPYLILGACSSMCEFACASTLCPPAASASPGFGEGEHVAAAR